MFTDVGGRSEVRVMGLQADPWKAARSDIFIRYNLTKKVRLAFSLTNVTKYFRVSLRRYHIIIVFSPPPSLSLCLSLSTVQGVSDSAQLTICYRARATSLAQIETFISLAASSENVDALAISTYKLRKLYLVGKGESYNYVLLSRCTLLYMTEYDHCGGDS